MHDASLAQIVAISEVRSDSNGLKRYEFIRPSEASPFDANRVVREITSSSQEFVPAWAELYNSSGLFLSFQGMPVGFGEYNFNNSSQPICFDMSLIGVMDFHYQSYPGYAVSGRENTVLLGIGAPRLEGRQICRVARPMGDSRLNMHTKKTVMNMNSTDAEIVYNTINSGNNDVIYSNLICRLQRSNRRLTCDVVSLEVFLLDEGYNPVTVFWQGRAGAASVTQGD